MTDHSYLGCVWQEYKLSQWAHCPQTAQFCILYGCLDGHLNEVVYCGDHVGLWTHLADGLRCWNVQCGQKIEEWSMIPIQRLTPAFALYMRTRQ